MNRRDIRDNAMTRVALAFSRGHPRLPVALGDSRPLVSVVIPCYNYGRFLPRCVASVTGQVGVDVEVIIVDDCSTDDSADVADRLAARDPRVTVIRHPQNKGHIATYNDGLDAATGKYVALVSADDLLTEGSLSRAAALLEAEPSVGYVYGQAVRFTGDELPETRAAVSVWVTWHGTDWLRLRCRSGYNVIASPEVLMRTTVLRQIGGYRPDLPQAGDFEMWMRAATVADVGFLVGADQALYRVHDMNMHKTIFDSGRVGGQLHDLQQRASSFEAIFERPGGDATTMRRFEHVARRTLAVEAVDSVNYAYARGFADFPIDGFVDVALGLDPDVMQTRAGRALRRRTAHGMSRLPVHPLWAPRAAWIRSVEQARRWRRHRVGI